MSARQRILSESLGGTQPKAFAIATSRIFVCCTFHKRVIPFTLTKSREEFFRKSATRRKPENKGVDKTAIRRTHFVSIEPSFQRKPPKNRSKKRHPKKSGRKCMQGRGENPQYAPILLPISYHSKPKMSSASLFSISISSIPIYTRVTIFCRFAASLPFSLRSAPSRHF